MPDLQNATPFAASCMPSADRAGQDLMLVVIAAHFALPDAHSGNSRWQLFPTQDEPPLIEQYIGEPGQSSVLRDGQSVYMRPATDICIVGEACAPDERPATEVDVRIRVGPCAVDLRVSGDRAWTTSISGNAVPSDPEPFLRMPLIWERAYGGVALSSTAENPAFESRNPVGCGFEVDESDALGRPIPNIEDVRSPLRSVSDRPTPAGLTPVARGWQPRVQYAGTYDEHWKRHRAPLWPEDFDERFFCGAPAYLQAEPHLVGAEPVYLEGLYAAGPMSFRLPSVHLSCRSSFVDRTVRSVPVLDGVLIDTVMQRLTMYYRAAVPAPLALARHRETLVRLVAPWEEALSQ